MKISSIKNTAFSLFFYNAPKSVSKKKEELRILISHNFVKITLPKLYILIKINLPTLFDKHWQKQK